jgi:hypothetical protein
LRNFVRSARGITVAGIYVTPERRASLLRMGMTDSYPEACSAMVMDADGDSIVAQALRSDDAICIENGTHSPKYSLKYFIS